MQHQKYSKQFHVHYYEVNNRQQATLITILNYLEETAICHSQSVGYGIDRLSSQNTVWVLNRWSLIIDRYPEWNEEVTVLTWPSNFERFYGTREFYIKDRAGNIIVRATSLWIYLDTIKRRPIRIPQSMGESYGIQPDRAIAENLEDIGNIPSGQFSKKFNVRRSDIDTNNHVNNTKYIEWILESVPDEIYDNFYVNTLEISYKKETHYGSSINVSFSTNVNIGLDCKAFHTISSCESGEELVTAKTTWKKHL